MNSWNTKLFQITPTSYKVFKQTVTRAQLILQSFQTRYVTSRLCSDEYIQSILRAAVFLLVKIDIKLFPLCCCAHFSKYKDGPRDLTFISYGTPAVSSQHDCFPVPRDRGRRIRLNGGAAVQRILIQLSSNFAVQFNRFKKRAHTRELERYTIFNSLNLDAMNLYAI